jgi:hypothetical protein
MATTTINLTAVNEAKESFKASLLKQIEPIDAKISQHKQAIAQLELEKRQVQTLLNNLDKKPSQGRVWSAEAKAKLSASLKAAAARKKAAQGQGAAAATPAPQGTQAPAPDAKMRAANDDSAPATSTKKNRSSAR